MLVDFKIKSVGMCKKFGHKCPNLSIILFQKIVFSKQKVKTVSGIYLVLNSRQSKNKVEEK